MRFTTELAPLLAAVKRARGVIENRQVIPILGCVHIKAADDCLRITGTNMNEWVAVKCAASVEDPGATCVDAGLLLAWLSTAPKGALIAATLEDHRLVMAAGRAKASFATLSPDDYPTPEKSNKGEEVAGAFAALAMCLPFAAVEEPRWYLNGVAINKGHAVATDGHRMCAVNIGAPAGVAAIIPTQGVRQIIQFSQDAKLWIGPNAWRCEDEVVVAGGKLIDGSFPDWQRLIPSVDPLGTVDADAMAYALSQVVVASTTPDKRVKLTATGGAIELVCVGDAMVATGHTPYEGQAFEFGINGKYAETALRVFAGNVLSLAVVNGVALLTCPALPDVRVLVMGMRI